MGELKRKADWEGRYVKLKHRIETKGGTVFEAGEVMLVIRNFGGLHLRTTRNCSECNRAHRVWINKVSEWEVDLLPKEYVPPGNKMI